MLGIVRALALLLVGSLLAGPELQARSEQILPLTYNQGVAHVEGGWVFSGTRSPLPDTDVLVRTNEALDVLLTLEKPIPEPYRSQGYNHVGDGDVVNGVLYVPFEQPNYDLGHQVTARYDATTLRFMDAVELPQHENSFVALDPATMTAYTMDHFDGDALLRYDVTNGWAPLEPLRLSMALQHTQGADVADGAVWISTSDADNDVYRVDGQTGATTNAGTLGHRGAEGEGFDATVLPSGAFHGMINDLQHRQVDFVHYDFAQAKPVEATNPVPTGSNDSRTWWLVAVAAVVCGVGIGIAIRLWRLRRTPS